MILITVYGLDAYTVGHYSGVHTKNIANLFEVPEEEILFNATGEYIFHDGVEQTSWNAVVEVSAPDKFEPMEEKVSKYLIETLKEFSINLVVNFKYFHGHHQHSFVNKEYPRFITDQNMVHVEEDEDEELYEGNVFEGMEKKLEEAYREPHDHCDCGCEGECDCDDDCECEEGECHCGHQH